MSIGKHRVGHPSRVSDIHVRLTGAGVICGASSRVTNPISGRAGLVDFSLIGSSISWGHPVPPALEHHPPKTWRRSCFGGFGPLIIECSLLTACRRGSGQESTPAAIA